MTTQPSLTADQDPLDVSIPSAARFALLSEEGTVYDVSTVNPRDRGAEIGTYTTKTIGNTLAVTAVINGTNWTATTGKRQGTKRFGQNKPIPVTLHLGKSQ